MLDRYDSSELLALIEGELDAAAAAALERRLAGDPQASARVQAMIRDRAALRAFEEPALPTDFISTIEPMLSRPMLIEPVAEVIAAVPGEFRRQHRRRNSTRRWGRLAAAAALLLAAMGGTWAAYENWDAWVGRDSGGSLVASDDLGAGTGSRTASTVIQPAPGAASGNDAGALGPGVIHHDLRPSMVASSSSVAAPRSTAEPFQPNAEPTTLLADFAIVVSSRDASVAEERFTGVLAGMGANAALVRNFSFAEAQALAEEYRVAHAGPLREGDTGARDRRAASTEPAIAPGTSGLADSSLTRIEMQQLAQRVRDQLRTRAASDPNVTPGSGSALLAGAQSLSPTLEQQLDLSSRGATHTIAIPASELVTLIERIALSDPTSAATSLRMLPKQASGATDGAADGATSSSALAWLSDGPLVRQAMQRLAQARGDAIVLLPVIVR